MIKLLSTIWIFFFIISFSYSLKLTEVYFDWSDEYVWIYSQNWFSWDIILSWAKKSNIQTYINIKPKEEIIIWDDGIQNYFSWFTDFKTWLTLSISDAKAIDIDLMYSWDVVDNFYVPVDIVDQLNNQTTAFWKVFSWNNEIIKAVENPINMKDWYIWNPWYVEWISNNIQNNNKDCNLTTWTILNCFIKLDSKDKDIYNMSFTWNKSFTWVNWFIDNKFYKTWLSLSTSSWWYIKAVWNYKNYTCTWSFYISKEINNWNNVNNTNNWNIILNEIHAWNKDIWEYVELKSFWNFSWNLIFSWFLRWDNTFTLPIQTYSWWILVLAKSYSWFVYTWNVIKVSNLSLKDNWWKLVIEKSGQVLDTVVYQDTSSRYYSYTSGDVRYFKKTWLDSPWFNFFVTKYYKKDQSYDCDILYQSFKKWKLNLNSKVSDDTLCWDNYRQVWTYSWWTVTWTCNPPSITINNQNQQIFFNIFSWDKLLCKDTYNFFYNEDTQSNTTSQTNLNCSIQIQWKDTYFFSDELLNFISLVNDKEIQNSNTNYTCKYFLDDNLLSEKCNPSSKNISSWLHKLKLSISSNTWLTCQTTMDLNNPTLSKDYIVSSFTVDDFKDIMEKVKSKYSDTSLKNIIEPLSYLYNQENYIKSLNSTELKQLISNINNKYTSEYTLKNIFEPIKYLYEKELISDIDNCAKLNSYELSSLTKKVSEKYKTDSTLKRIYDPIRFLYEKENNNFTWNDDKSDFTWNLHIIKLLPNPLWKDTWKESIVLSWDIIPWITIWTKTKKYILSNYSLTWNNYLFTWSFGFTNKAKCINLYKKENIIDTVCYVNAQEWKYINNLIRPTDKVLFKQNYIILDNKIIENKPFIDLKNKIKKAVKIIEKRFKNIISKNNKLKRDNDKLYQQFIKRLIQYYKYKNKYTNIKKTFIEKNKKKYKTIIEKNKKIKILKNINTFLKSFIVYSKKYIPKEYYRQYLDKYKQAIQWKKIRF